MEEREPEERAEQAPLPAGDEPTEEAPALSVDSPRGPAMGEDLSETPSTLPDVPDDLIASPPGAGSQPDIVQQVELGGAEAAGTGEALATEPVVAALPATSPAVGSLRGGRMPQGDVTAESSTEPAWYVIHCYSGYENKVRHNLEQRIETMGMKDKIFDVVIPTQEEIEVREGKRRTVERHIFPGYVLVNMSLSEESWYVVRNTPGVTGFVGMGNLPTALRPEEVSQIIKRMEADAPTVKVSFKVGERVRIVDGPFNDFRGTVADIDMERTKVRVMVSFFGRETPVELDFLQVEKA
jgi:transcriptional antiterminator NusG